MGTVLADAGQRLRLWLELVGAAERQRHRPSETRTRSWFGYAWILLHTWVAPWVLGALLTHRPCSSREISTQSQRFAPSFHGTVTPISPMNAYADPTTGTEHGGFTAAGHDDSGGFPDRERPRYVASGAHCRLVFPRVAEIRR